MLRTMKSFVFFILTISTLNHITVSITEDIPPIELRIRHLKRQIFEEIKGLGISPPESDHYKEIYDYVDNSNKPIIPISDNDERKLHERYKRPELRSTTTEKFVASPEKTEEKAEEKTEEKAEEKRVQLRSKKQKKKKNFETFYRKMGFNPHERDRPQKWMHCLDLLSPFLNGFLNNITVTKRVYATDHTIRKLRHLLTMDITATTTADEIRSILYEISNLQLRIFQWDIAAVRTIVNVITGDRQPNFKGLKYGLKSLMATWKLNTSNLTRVLTQSRIFRPPCIHISGYTGSTVTQKGIRYSKPTNEKQSICVYRNGQHEC